MRKTKGVLLLDPYYAVFVTCITLFHDVLVLNYTISLCHSHAAPAHNCILRTQDFPRVALSEGHVQVEGNAYAVFTFVRK